MRNSSVRSHYNATQGTHDIYIDNVLMASADDDLYYRVLIKAIEDLRALQLIRSLWGNSTTPSYSLAEITKFREVIANIDRRES